MSGLKATHHAVMQYLKRSKRKLPYDRAQQALQDMAYNAKHCCIIGDTRIVITPRKWCLILKRKPPYPYKIVTAFPIARKVRNDGGKWLKELKAKWKQNNSRWTKTDI